MANGTAKDWAPEIRPDADEKLVRQSVKNSSSPAAARVAVTVAADVLSLVATAVITGGLIVALGHVPGIRRLMEVYPSNGSTGMILLLTMVPYWLFLLYAFGLYRASGSSIRGTSIENAMRGFTALTVGSWLLFLAMVLLRGVDSPLGALAVFWAVATVAIPFGRWTARVIVWRRPAFAERVLIVGAGTVGHTLAAKIAKHPEYRIELVGFLEDGEPMPNGAGPEIPVIGSLHDLEEVIGRERVNRVILAFSQARHQQFLTVARICAEHGVKVNIVPRLFEVLSSRAGVDDLEGIPLLDIVRVELGHLNMIVKRTFDLFVGGVLTFMCLPLFAVVAVLIKLDSPGPVFFRQERMGRHGRIFRIIKFRSMMVGAEGRRGDLAPLNEYSGPMFKMKVDPRVTRVGAWLRRTSLDELPQLFNVLRGSMSLVGPRPLWVEEAKQCKGWTKKRLDITPGITGLWQVMGRNDIPFDEMVKLDYFYVTGWSLSWDVRLLLETIPVVLGRRGAY
jgi:exopolysaccharide biosynthesis polyprenyl glycosylphosphotransferase